MKKLKVLFQSFVITVLFGFCQNVALDHLNLAVFFDRAKNASELPFCGKEDMYALDGELGAIDGPLAVAIFNQVPILTNANLLRNLIYLSSADVRNEWKKHKKDLPKFVERSRKLEEFKRSNLPAMLQKNFKVYVTKNPNLQFILLLPQKIDITKAGFNSKEFDQISSEQVMSTVGMVYANEKDRSWADKPLDINELQKIFITKEPISKCIYLDGHGNPDEPQRKRVASIAGLTIKQYQQFLEILNTINTEFFYVSSCYAGGLNLEKMHDVTLKQSETASRDVRNINFIIAIGSTGDWVTHGGTECFKDEEKEGCLNFNKFFSALDSYLYYSSSKKTTLKDVIAQVTSIDEMTAPLIRFPGVQNYFNVLNVEGDIGRITYTMQKAQMLPISPKPSAISFKNKSYIFVYPAVIECPVKIESGEPVIISMIKGNAIHFFEKLEIPGKDLPEITKDILQGFPTNERENGAPMPYKIFCIKELICKSGNLPSKLIGNTVKIKNVCVYHNPNSRESKYPECIVNINDIDYEVVITSKEIEKDNPLDPGSFTLVTEETIDLEELTKEAALKRRTEIVTKVLSNKQERGRLSQSIKYATYGNQDLNMLEDALKKNNFLRS